MYLSASAVAVSTWGAITNVDLLLFIPVCSAVRVLICAQGHRTPHATAVTLPVYGSLLTARLTASETLGMADSSSVMVIPQLFSFSFRLYLYLTACSRVGMYVLPNG